MENNSEIAWAAGFIDGEGTICIQRRTREKRNREYAVALTAENTDPAALLLLMKLFGGYVYQRSIRRKHHFGKRPIFSWKAHRGNIGSVLKALLPYLILKKPQAELALAFERMKQRRQPGIGSRGCPFEAEEIAWRESIYLQMRELNKGPKQLLLIPRKTKNKSQLSMNMR